MRLGGGDRPLRELGSGAVESRVKVGSGAEQQVGRAADWQDEKAAAGVEPGARPRYGCAKMRHVGLLCGLRTLQGWGLQTGWVVFFFPLS